MDRPVPAAPIASQQTLMPHGDAADERRESCDYCGSARLEWRKCKLICAECHQINKSCADL